jgi:hypothetical protein
VDVNVDKDVDVGMHSLLTSTMDSAVSDGDGKVGEDAAAAAVVLRPPGSPLPDLEPTTSSGSGSGNHVSGGFTSPASGLDLSPGRQVSHAYSYMSVHCQFIANKRQFLLEKR